MTEPDEPEAPLDPTSADALEDVPDLVLELAASAFRMVKQTLKIDLDFTSDTLPLLDHHLASARAEVGKSPALADVLASSAGGYFGEVVRRRFPQARWHVEPSDFAGWRIELGHVFLWFNPIGVALEALHGEARDGWAAHLEVLPEDRAMLEQSLARLGDVGEDDYYTLAVRFEVIEHAIAALEAAQVARGEVGRTFPREVYAAAAGQPSQAPAS